MPNISGVELATEVRRLDSNVSIILMSAFDMNELGVSSELHIAELLQKPVTVDRIKEIVSKYVIALPTK